MSDCVIGVDVGTASVRAGLFDLSGRMLSTSAAPIDVYRDGDFAEQSSAQIWERTGEVVRGAVSEAGVTPDSVAGISFDATCSLVALGADGKGVTVSPGGDPTHDIIMWMDHRATDITEEINATGHPVLKYVGGIMSPEMEPPKLKWLKTHLPDSWAAAAKFFDLADFLVWRATGVDVRSVCTCVCKWTYVAHESRWDASFFEQVGLDDLFYGGRVSDDIRPMGEPAGPLTPEAAVHLGLTTSTKVGVGIIDAHAGGLGVMGGGLFGPDEAPDPHKLEQVLALIGGTSSCHMAVSAQPRFVQGVWGPYFSAMVPGMWLTEGGQSATGGLIDHVIFSHAASVELKQLAEQSGRDVYQVLNDRVRGLQERESAGSTITRHFHVLPYYHGNRSPRADPRATGLVEGLRLDASLDSLALSYYAHIQAVAYGTRHIIDALEEQGYRITRIHACGGGTKNPVWLQEHADITGRDIYLPREPEAVLLGSAMLGAVAAGKYASIPAAMQGMSASGEQVVARPEFRAYHDAKQSIFHALYDEQRKRRQLMDSVGL